MDQIECPHCQRQCIPKLWHYSPIFGGLRYMATQHICPFCGGGIFSTRPPSNFFCLSSLFFFLVDFLFCISSIKRHLSALSLSITKLVVPGVASRASVQAAVSEFHNWANIRRFYRVALCEDSRGEPLFPVLGMPTTEAHAFRACASDELN